MIMIDVTEYKRILNQRDETIIRQADEIAELREYLKFAVAESEYDEGCWNDAAWSNGYITAERLYELLEKS